MVLVNCFETYLKLINVGDFEVCTVYMYINRLTRYVTVDFSLENLIVIIINNKKQQRLSLSILDQRKKHSDQLFGVNFKINCFGLSYIR